MCAWCSFHSILHFLTQQHSSSSSRPTSDADAFAELRSQLDVLKIAADRGDPVAKRHLATCVMNGEGTMKNEANAVALYKEAGKAGDARSLHILV